MRRLFIVLFLFGCRAAVAADDDFVVHEWGTFTSVSGADGVRLEFRPLVDSDLPDFVLNRPRQAGIAAPIGSKLDYRVFQRMETPVTYFYTDRDREVRVKVGFPSGLLTEFYPPVATMKPDFVWNKRAAVGQSELDWGTVSLIPAGRLRPSLDTPGLADRVQAHLLRTLVPTSDERHYAYARETESALVHVARPRDAKRPAAPSGDFFEKFLFYRGVGNFTLPLTVTSRGSEQFEATNSGPDPIRSLFLVTVHDQVVRFRQYDAIPANGRLTLRLDAEAASVESLAEAVVRALIAERLYEPEARAMVKTWRDSWFAEEGTRLFYMLPARRTDELLPLTIEPRPRETVRVMVGRMELMTPEEEQRLVSIVRQSAVARAAHAKGIAERRAAAAEGKLAESQVEDRPLAIPPALLKLGRLAEPAMVRVKFYAREPELRQEAAQLLSDLLRHWSLAEATADAAG